LQRNRFGRYSKGMCVFKFENFHLLITLFFVFLTFLTVYNLKDSYVIYKNWSTFHNKHVGQYPEGIGVLKFENFHILVKLLSIFLPFSRLQFK